MSNDLTVDDDGINFIKQFEGFRSDPYQDSVGVWTVGYGSTFLPDGSRVTADTPSVDEDDAVSLLKHALTKFEKVINEVVTVELNQNQFNALADFVYNVGSGNFESSTLLKDINAGDFTSAAEQFGRWNKAGGHVLAGLTTRRGKESELFLS